MESMATRLPINKTAALVVSKGVEFMSDKKIQTNDSPTPLKTRLPTKIELHNKWFKDLRGVKFGRFTVLGISADFKKSWVVKCSCGMYTTRRAKAIQNPHNTQDRCERCRELAFLKRNTHYRAYGVEVDINKY